MDAAIPTEMLILFKEEPAAPMLLLTGGQAKLF